MHPLFVLYSILLYYIVRLKYQELVAEGESHSQLIVECDWCIELELRWEGENSRASPPVAASSPPQKISVSTIPKPALSFCLIPEIFFFLLLLLFVCFC